MPRRRPLLLVSVVTLVAAGCGWNDAVDSRTATAGLPTPRQLVQEHEWVLAAADTTPTIEGGGQVTLSVAGDDLSGMAPCNAYRGHISLDYDDSVEISDITHTLRDCGTPTMQAEARFLAALEAVDSVDADEDHNRRLVLHDGEVDLVFRSYDMDELLTTAWTITDVSTNHTIDGVLPGTEPTLTFAEDGHLTMAMRCATATTSWELDGHTLSIDPPALTPRPCSAAPGVRDQQAALVDALEAADRVEIAPGQLAVLDADGAITLLAVGD